jgi:hypothetical protein
VPKQTKAGRFTSPANRGNMIRLLDWDRTVSSSCEHIRLSAQLTFSPPVGYASACCLCKKGATGSPTSQWTQDSVCKWCGENETTVTVGASQCLPCPFGTATLQGGQCHQGPQQYPPCGVCCKPAKEGMKRDVHATNECKFIPQNTTVSTN